MEINPQNSEKKIEKKVQFTIPNDENTQWLYSPNSVALECIKGIAVDKIKFNTIHALLIADIITPRTSLPHKISSALKSSKTNGGEQGVQKRYARLLEGLKNLEKYCEKNEETLFEVKPFDSPIGGIFTIKNKQKDLEIVSNYFYPEYITEAPPFLSKIKVNLMGSTIEH